MKKLLMTTATTEGQEIKVEYSFGYVEDKDGDLKINLHHSSLPYCQK